MRIIKKFRVAKIVAFCGTLLPGLFLFNSAFASENIDYNVSVASSLTLTIPTSSIVLNLDPSSKTFDSKNLTVSVGTNNKTGYTLTLSTPSNNTDLNRDSSSDSIVAKIETLASGTYTQATFTEDKWGYSINSNTAIPSTITSGYVPFVSGNTLMERSTAVNNDETELTFAAKIDYLQPAGSYATQLNFNIVANPLMDYIQDITPTMCRTLASSADYQVLDKRDGNNYTIRWINGNCWMTENLRFSGTTLDPATSNVASTTSITYGELEDGNSWDEARIHVGLDSNGDSTVWYNYAAASAMTVVGPQNYNDGSYDICPKGWRLPIRTEIINITGYSSAFSPVGGGQYGGGQIIGGDTTQSLWWSSTYGGYAARYCLYNSSGTLSADKAWINGSRASGNYIRCVHTT